MLGCFIHSTKQEKNVNSISNSSTLNIFRESRETLIPLIHLEIFILSYFTIYLSNKCLSVNLSFFVVATIMTVWLSLHCLNSILLLDRTKTIASNTLVCYLRQVACKSSSVPSETYLLTSLTILHNVFIYTFVSLVGKTYVSTAIK